MYDYLLKLLLIGDMGVGKTCMLKRFVGEAFTSSYINTLGIDFEIKTVEIDGKKVKLQIWDTAGQERFRSMATPYYRGAMGVILVYDVSSEQTFKSIKEWMKQIGEHAPADVERILVGNKCDLSSNEREVPKEKGEKLALEYGIKFFETSAKKNENIETVFFTLAKDIMRAKQALLKPPKTGLPSAPAKKSFFSKC